MPVRVDWTVEMLESLPDDGQRYEIIDGELFVTPAPVADHQRVARELVRRLDTYLRGRRVGEVLFAPVDVRKGDRTSVQPDILVARVDLERKRQPRFAFGDLLLAIEIVSPSSARADRRVKRSLYQRAGVPEYWVVDMDARSIDRWMSSDARPEVLAESLVWHPAGMSQPLVVDVQEIFRDALDA